MEIVSIFIWVIVVTMFVVMIAVILKGGNAWVYIFDEHNGVYKKRGRIKGDTVSFKYNNTTKGGVAIEGNKYKQGKKKAFFYRDVNGILIPITDKKINEKIGSLDLSTSQEKLYETEALKNVAKKIDNTWWTQIKPLIMGFIIIFGAVIVSIVMVQKALDVEPIPEPQVEMWKETQTTNKELVESIEVLVGEIRTEKAQNKEGDQVPK